MACFALLEILGKFRKILSFSVIQDCNQLLGRLIQVEYELKDILGYTVELKISLVIFIIP